VEVCILSNYNLAFRLLRASALLLIPNVTGLITSHGGADFRTVLAALAAVKYTFGALVIDAARFVPQS
jgi:DNA (cytosine-5)-methyltransferase 1